MRRSPINTPTKFWAMVKKGPIDACWDWKGSIRRDGYGSAALTVQSVYFSKAHRVAFVLHFGPIPNGLHVLHACNNKRCCNPSHLYPGTRARNLEDLYQTMEQIGKIHPNSKLTKNDVREIRRLSASGTMTIKQIGDRFGITDGGVQGIISKRRWKRV